MTPIPDSFGASNETINAAAARLRPRLKSLLAAQVLKAILGDSSPLKVSADIFPVDAANKPLGAGRTLKSRGVQAGAIQTQSIKTQPLKLGTNLGVRIKNSEAQNLYVATLVISDSGEMGVLFPFGYEAPDAASLVAPTKPNEDGFVIPVPFEIYGTPRSFEPLILLSREPLRDALRALKNIAGARGIRKGAPAGLEANEADTVVSSLLGDIDRTSRSTSLRVPSSYTAIDAGKLAALSAVFQVVQ